MSKSSSNASWIKVVTILMPIVAALAVIFLVFLQVSHLRSLSEQRAKTEQNMAILDHIALDMKAHPTNTKVAAIPPDPNEQSLFLDMVRKFADQSKVHLVRYTNRPAPVQNAESPDAKKNATPLGVTTLTSDLEVSGNYNGIRLFLYQLLHSPRLYNTTDLRWSRGANPEKWPATHLAFTLLRYVATPIVPKSKPTGDTANPPTNS